MAVVTVTELPLAREGQIDLFWNRTYRRVLQVKTNSKLDGPAIVRAGCGVSIGTAYASGSDADSGSFASRISARCISKDGLEWEVTVEYAPYDVLLATESPIDARPKFTWSFQAYEEIVDQDVAGAAVVNSAGDYFDPPIVRDRSRAILTAERNELVFDPDLASLYQDKINSDIFRGIAAGLVKVAQISATEEYHPAVGKYAKVNYEFHIDRRGWKSKPLDQGMRKRSGSTRQQIIVDNAPISSPALLDGSGGVLSPTGTPVFLEFDVYEPVAFSVFNLEDPP